MDNIIGIVIFIFIFILSAGIYLIPSIIAFRSNHPNKGAIMALNILAGWTFIVWVVSLVWALTKHEETPRDVYVVRESTVNQKMDWQNDQYVSPGSSRGTGANNSYATKDDDIDIELF